ncbi:MAG: hypothetical protein QM813_15960 [Verrucomicrobiota bacterium]
MRLLQNSKVKAGSALLLLLTVAALLTGCATAEPDNLSVRPWNSPKGWENGLPSGMMEGR